MLQTYPGHKWSHYMHIVLHHEPSVEYVNAKACSSWTIVQAWPQA